MCGEGERRIAPRGAWRSVTYFASDRRRLPAVYDVSDSVATIVNADSETTWDALLRVDLIEVGRRQLMVAVLGALRALPDIVSHVLHGELPLHAPKHMRLRDTANTPVGEGCWVLLGTLPTDRSRTGRISGGRNRFR